jgi:imidazolonepropionase-like amidohydrolase
VSSPLVLEHATIIDGTGRDPRPMSRVVVEDGRIRRIARSDTSALPRGARVIDCRGRTLMPGLLDAHVHLAAVELDPLKEAALPPAVLALRIARQIEATLQAGFTTVRDAGGLDFGYREASRLGLIRGPRLLVSGPFLSQTGGHGDWRPRTSRLPLPTVPGILAGTILADGPEEVRRAAREALRRGADQIKVMASGGAMSPTDELDHTQFSVEELGAAVAVARAAGTYVLAHAYGPAAIQNCLHAGVRSIEHGNFLDEETADRMRAAGDIYLVPTIITYELIAAHGARDGVTEDNLRKIQKALSGAYNALRLAHQKGLRIASGSDLLASMQPHKGRELACQARVLGAMGAIVAATRTTAELCRLDHELGTVEEGKRADLLVVAEDPLAHPEVFGDPTRIPLVVMDGMIVKDVEGEAVPAGVG